MIRIRDLANPGSGIQSKHPGSATLEQTLLVTGFFIKNVLVQAVVIWIHYNAGVQFWNGEHQLDWYLFRKVLIIASSVQTTAILQYKKYVHRAVYSHSGCDAEDQTVEATPTSEQHEEATSIEQTEDPTPAVTPVVASDRLIGRIKDAGDGIREPDFVSSTDSCQASNLQSLPTTGIDETEPVLGEKTEGRKPELRVPEWVGDPRENLAVILSARARADLEGLALEHLTWLRSREELEAALRHASLALALQQCSGSMTFWCGSGSADPCL